MNDYQERNQDECNVEGATDPRDDELNKLHAKLREAETMALGNVREDVAYDVIQTVLRSGCSLRDVSRSRIPTKAVTRLVDRVRKKMFVPFMIDHARSMANSYASNLISTYGRLEERLLSEVKVSLEEIQRLRREEERKAREHQDRIEELQERHALETQRYKCQIAFLAGVLQESHHGEAGERRMNELLNRMRGDVSL